MKKVLFLAMIMLMACSASFAQTEVEIMRERQWIVKQTKQELDARVSKETKKEAKRLQKEGWMVSPGALPLEKQLERAYLMQYEYDANLYPKYIIANGQSIGENYDAAKTTAMSLAINDLAGQIQTEVSAWVDNNVANQQLPAEAAISITEVIKESQQLINQRIGRVITITECYRVLANKNREVLVRIAYDGELAKKMTLSAIQESLQKKDANLYQQFEKVVNL